MPRALLASAKKRRVFEAAADSPQAIKRKIDKSFEWAEQDLKDPKRVKHPTKKHLKLVDASPFIPDLDAFPDSGAYITLKFLTNPVPGSSEYDKRLLSSMFRPIDKSEDEEKAYEAAMEAYQQDPENNPKPPNLMNYDFYLAQNGGTGDRFRRAFDVENPDHNDEELYTHETDTGGCFRFDRLRAYETAQEVELDHPTKFDDEVLLAYNDDTFYPNQKATYYYPIMQKSTIRPQRTRNIARVGGYGGEEEQVVDQLDVTVQDPTDEIRDDMKRYREHPLGWDHEEEEEAEEADDDHHHDEDAARRGSSPAAQRSRSPSEERDAEGEDDD